MYSLNELRALIAVGQRKNFRKAAIDLSISASTLSHQISQLEKRLDVRLINRTTRSVSLSDAGKAFLSKIEPALADIANAFASISDYKEKPNGRIKINASKGAGRLILMPYIQRFMKHNPEIQIEIVTEDRLIDIVAEGFDFGLRGSELVAKDMIAIPLGPRELSFAVVGSPQYFKRKTIPVHPNDLLTHQCIRYRMGSGALYQWEFERRGKEIKVDVQGNLTLDDDTLSLIAALDGMGLSYQSEWAVSKYLNNGKLIRCLEDWTPPSPALSLYYSSSRHKSAAVKAFVDFIRDVS